MDLLTFAKSEMPTGSGWTGSKPQVSPAVAAKFMRLQRELKGKKGGERRLAFSKFIKEYNVFTFTYFGSLLQNLGTDCLVSKKDGSSTGHPHAQTVESLTVQGIVKYLSEHTTEFIAMLECFSDKDIRSMWVDQGLNANQCLLSNNKTQSGFWIGMPDWDREQIIDLYDHVAGEALLYELEDDNDKDVELPQEELALPDLDPAVEAMLNHTLRGAGVPEYDAIREQMAALNESAAKGGSGGLTITVGEVKHESQNSDVPDLKNVTVEPAKDRGLPSKFDMQVPVLEWSFNHPAVPEINEDYIMRPEIVDPLIYALLTNKRIWIYGHTGTGKSSLVDQAAARIMYPVVRINFDSEISRMDLIGREVLREENGVTVSKFVDGILPTAMQQPCILALDEIDFVRSDVSYVLQRLLEDDGELIITEDGGRRVKPHPMFRIVATANTQGNGDETGHYTGARVQSAAFLDRFTVWSEATYLTKQDVLKLVDNNETIANYYAEHVAAFIGNSVRLPLTPRGLTSWADLNKVFNNVNASFEATILNRASEADRAVMKGIVDRVAA